MKLPGTKIWLRFSVKTRLILLFIIIKVVPLVLLVGIAWNRTQEAAEHLGDNLDRLVGTEDAAINSVGSTAIQDAVEALDARAREEIERQTTDTARQVADFLYSRDVDIRYAATLPTDAASYRNFVETKRRDVVRHGAWRLNKEQTDWEPEAPPVETPSSAEPGSKDNATNFHYRHPVFFHQESRPLYLEMSFIGLDGKEQMKVTTSGRINPKLQDISRRENTYAGAENYFSDLKRLKPGEIYVSEVIGAYVGTPIIGKFTPAAAKKIGIPFEPEKYAYAGKENPVGKRFQGIVRWATPVLRNQEIIGWVSFALDHDHLMNFTDTIVPTEERYRDINDAHDGNYAFIWDYQGKSIVHPRHHSIVGYAPGGEPEVPWLEDKVYDEWKKSGQSWAEYRKTAPTFVDQLQSRKPAQPLTKEGRVALDCRWLNFAPQCTGWYNLARHGGSGSFLILWSGLWKLTTTAAIPYYTGRYSPERTGNRIGFGIVTIGANVDNFHRAANESKERIDKIIEATHQNVAMEGDNARNRLGEDMTATAFSLTFSTFVLIVLVIIIAIWMASFLSRKILWLNEGYNRFRQGEKSFRFSFDHEDEISTLATSFNTMADTINQNIARLEEEIDVRTRTETELRDIQTHLEHRITERTRELSEANELLSSEVLIRRISEEKAQYLAGHDALTGLDNRLLFNKQLQKTISFCARSGKFGALLFFDLDKFKQVNDTLGHHVGDTLLVHMAKTLQGCIRESDSAARLGGDEFAVIMSEVSAPERAAALAQRILEKLSTPLHVEGHEIPINTSIGITVFRNKTSGIPDELIREADIAMYLAKTKGGRRFQFFEAGLQKKLQVTSRLTHEISVALAENQFMPFFQPLFHATRNDVLYLEALTRWQHPQRGVLQPADFMETLTPSTISRAIKERICGMTCTQVRTWLDAELFAGRALLGIPRQFLEQPGFVDTVRAILDEHELPPWRLALEIEGYASLDNSEQAAHALQELRAMGIEILVDRKNTEEAPLRNFLEYAVDAIRIDLNETRHTDDPHMHATIETIATIAHAHTLRLIIEGVENKTQWDFSATLDCQLTQCYKAAAPMNAENTEAFLRKHPPVSS
ncbi:MAG: diguanylate cyclase [Betaproteobacteria bacterium]|nr:diguanylate cyclase [Betaproteobacteria bacterium]